MSDTSMTITSIITAVWASLSPPPPHNPPPLLSPLTTRWSGLESVWIIKCICNFAANETRWGQIYTTFVLTVTSLSIDCYTRPDNYGPHLSLQTPSRLLTVSFKTEEILCPVWVFSFDWGLPDKLGPSSFTFSEETREERGAESGSSPLTNCLHNIQYYTDYTVSGIYSDLHHLGPTWARRGFVMIFSLGK